MLSTKHHILLIGGTGLCGLVFLRAALEAKYEVTIYARTPSKVPEELSANPNLHIIQGELHEDEGLKKAAACGADIFICLAGPTLGRREGRVGQISQMTNVY
jgi:nucleoside-diphosphate-sugar epimerase